MVYSVRGHAAGKGAELLEGFLRRPRAVPIIVLLLWACAVLPNLTLPSFIWEEGTNAEIARDVLAHGHFLVPIVYGIPWVEKPSLLPWLIAGAAAVSGQVNEWSARLPAMISVLLTALMVQGLTRRYASLQASLFAALCFLFAPLLLQKLAIAEPDTLITLLSFAAFLVWWNGIAAGGVSILRWIVCGLLLAALVMAKGPQPAGFFALGTATYLMVERRWRDLPGWLLCMNRPPRCRHRMGRCCLPNRRGSDMALICKTDDVAHAARLHCQQ
jgi:4-amino-4-deoxy-L-arabinose transferase-like glycosyltransferase